MSADQVRREGNTIKALFAALLLWPTLALGATPSQYWAIGGSTSQVWSLIDASLKATSDSGYQAWVAIGNKPTPIKNAAELFAVIANAYPQFLASAAPGLDALGLNPSQAIQWRVAAGLQITSTGSSSLNGLYPINDLWLNGLISGALVRCGSTPLGSCTNAFPSGAATYSYVDQGGVAHTMTPTQMQNIVLAIQNYYAALYAQAQVALGGGTPSWPSGSVTIP